jgi:hypothetical protein
MKIIKMNLAEKKISLSHRLRDLPVAMDERAQGDESPQR